MRDANANDPGFGVYVHWPFCLAKCPYCDFNSHVRRAPVDQVEFATAMAREMAWFAERSRGRTVASVFFGGGTPSLMHPRTVGAVLEAVSRHWNLADDAEITLEANPTSAEARSFAGFRDAGVNRVSVGVQALDDDALKFLGRRHTAREALGAFELAARTFDRVSFDMIYARPRQTAEEWRRELRSALDRAEGHMSLYQLTIEPKTRFFDLHAAGKLTPPDETRALELFDVTQELAAGAGLPAYEVSNHAAPGNECRHNILYWTCGDYAGVGPGAHSRLTSETGDRIACAAIRKPEDWLAQVKREGHGIEDSETLGDRDRADECLLMGMRLDAGVDLKRHAALGGRPLDRTRLETLADEGLIEFDDVAGRISATAAGRRVLDALIGHLAAA